MWRILVVQYWDARKLFTQNEYVFIFFLFFSLSFLEDLPTGMNEWMKIFCLLCCHCFCLLHYTHIENENLYFMLAYISIKEKTNFPSLLYFPFINVTIIVYLRLFIMMMLIHTLSVRRNFMYAWDIFLFFSVDSIMNISIKYILWLLSF